MSAPGRTTSGPARGGFSAGVRFMLLSVFCLALMVLDQRDQHLSRVRAALDLAVYPVRVAVDLPFRAWSSVTTTFAARNALIAENEQLKRDRLNSEFRLQRLAALEMENARLRELLDSTARVGSRALIAEILSVDLDPYRQRFNLNRGVIDGVYVGQAVLDARGVVGQIVSVGPLTSEAVLVTDADAGMPVRVNRSQLRTIALGTGDSGRLRLPYLTNNADVEVGDLLVSSGLGGVFPADYPVGRITEVRRRPDQSFADVVAEPMSALDRDREVLLVWNAADEVPRASEAASLADPH
ncbi:MAG TPA: rod shape-determining protein MreC [Gammaproteobacteria bacterium]|nr:rod shape-determining protein MreC [Gammaproteobacteria bacterium]